LVSVLSIVKEALLVHRFIDAQVVDIGKEQLRHFT
jgi:hypothetical protein